MNTVPHITLEQVAAMYPHVNKHDHLGILGKENAQIDAYNKANAQQETYISAAQARELKAGNAEWRIVGNDITPQWHLCTEHTNYCDSIEYRYRAIKQAQPVSWNTKYADSTPRLNVGASAFEDWFQAQPFATQTGIKQMCRDSYAAGMGDPLVTYAAIQAQPEPVEPLREKYEDVVIGVRRFPDGSEGPLYKRQKVKPPEPQQAAWPQPYPQMHTESEAKAALKTQVDPHAALSTEYQRQRDAVPCELGFYLWEVDHLGGNSYGKLTEPYFHTEHEYRCTDISCYVSKDGEPAKRVLRTDAQKLQAELGDTVEWETPIGYRSSCDFKFYQKRTYTYRPKATIKLDGRMVTREQAVAEWESKKETCDLTYTDRNGIETIWLCPTLMGFSEVQEYQLRTKPAKVVAWSSLPVGVKVMHPGVSAPCEYRGVWQGRPWVANGSACIAASEGMTLAPSAEQPWIAMQDDDPHTMHGKEKWLATHGILIEVHDSEEKYRITGIAEGWKL